MTVAPRPLHGRHAPHRLPLALGVVLVLALNAIAVVLLIRYDVFGSSSSSSSVQGSGVEAAQRRELQPFSSVELAGSNNVVVHVGGKQSVVVHAATTCSGMSQPRCRPATS
jgi:hypothetical protein